MEPQRYQERKDQQESTGEPVEKNKVNRQPITREGYADVWFSAAILFAPFAF